MLYNACSYASGDVFICQDADDIPYPNRVEKIGYYFEKYDPDHLMHQWTGLEREGAVKFANQEGKASEAQFPSSFAQAMKVGSLTNGEIAIARRLFNECRWSNAPRGQDTIFNQMVYRLNKRFIVLAVPLVVYRLYLSSANNKTKRVLCEQPDNVIPGFVTHNPFAKEFAIHMIRFNHS